MKARARKNVALVVGMFLLLTFLGQGLVFIGANSQTYDEAIHLAAGYSYLAKRDFRLGPEHPPLLRELSALPVYLVYRLPFDPDPEQWRRGDEWPIGQDFLYGSSLSADRILALSRIPNLLLGAVLVALIGWWAYRLWGWSAAVVGMALAALEPNLVAHSSLVTTDLGATLFTFLTLYLLWEYVLSPSSWLLAATGISLGLALVSKYSTILLVGILGVVIAAHVLLGGSLPLPWAGRSTVLNKVRGRLMEAATVLVLILSFAALVIPPTYFFQGFAPWWAGLQYFLTIAEEGRPAFFFGAYAQDGWWSYFPVAFLVKTPVGSLLLILGALVLPWAGVPLGRREAIFLLGPVAFLFAAVIPAKVNIGLRHILPVYPFLFVFASRLATLQFRQGWLALLLLGLSLALTGLSSLCAVPHQLAYFNELVGGPGEGYRYLSDSNVDWGQDLKGVKDYMEQEGLETIYLSYFGSAPPPYYGIRYQELPAPGKRQHSSEVLPSGLPKEVLAISVVCLQGVWFEEKDLYRWLYQRTPVAKIGYSIFVYDLTGDAEAHIRLGEVYLKVGPRALAEPELRKALALDPSNSKALQLLAAYQRTILHRENRGSRQ